MTSNSLPSVHHLTDSPTPSGRSTPTSRRVHKFFDSYPQYTRRPADLFARNPTCSTSYQASLPPTPPSSSSSLPSTSGSPAHVTEALQHEACQRPLAVLQVPPSNIIYSAHYGYVYCMALVPSAREGSDDAPYGHPNTGERRDLQLVTGSGDETVKVSSSSQIARFDPLMRDPIELKLLSYGSYLLVIRSPSCCILSSVLRERFSPWLRAVKPCMRAVKTAMSRFGILRHVLSYGASSWLR